MPRFETPDPIVDEMSGKEFINLIRLCKMFPHRSVEQLSKVSKLVYQDRTLRSVLNLSYTYYVDNKAWKVSLNGLLASDKPFDEYNVGNND